MRPGPIALAIALAALAATGLPAHAGSGSVMVVFSKLGLIAGVGNGNGILTFRGKRYRFDVTGLGAGATAGVSTTRFVGTVENLDRPQDLAGTYSAAGGGAAIGAGVGRVRLQNDRGVILLLRGVKFGIELTANFGSVEITMR
ncbi:hypothetical protein JQ543_11810 [Bradyrhizobium diazoefficiens]|nr:hypothetical protein [Bradyrhizobium diazoefficiens]MBR0848428.1 hypothetical protein [Bradyrhizobium diazoefficiens]